MANLTVWKQSRFLCLINLFALFFCGAQINQIGKRNGNIIQKQPLYEVLTPQGGFISAVFEMSTFEGSNARKALAFVSFAIKM